MSHSYQQIQGYKQVRSFRRRSNRKSLKKTHKIGDIAEKVRKKAVEKI